MRNSRLGRLLTVSHAWLREHLPRSRTLLAVLLTALAASATVLIVGTVASPTEMILNRLTLVVLFWFNFVLMAVVLFVLGRSIVKLYLERSRNVLGSRFKTKMIVLTAGLVITPTILMFFTASGFLHHTVEAWFSLPVESVLADAKRLLDEYEAGELMRAETSARKLAEEVARRDLMSRRQRLSAAVKARLDDYGLGMMAVYDRNGKLVAAARVEQSGPRHTDLIPPKDIAELVAGERDTLPLVEDLTDRLLVAAGVPIGGGGTIQGAVVAGVYVGTGPRGALYNMAKNYEEYRVAKVSKEEIKRVFVLMLLFFTLLILFSAVWVGSTLAKHFTIPIQKLAEGTRAISEGRLDYRVDVDSHDELGILVRSFNQMTGELSLGKSDLERSNEELRLINVELESRRRYIETILKNSPSGVLALDPEGRMTTVNEAAQEMLGLDEEETHAGVHFKELLAAAEFLELRVLVGRLLGKTGQHFTRDLRLRLGSRQVDLRVRFTGLTDAEDRYTGLILVMEDLSQLIKSQKVEAWREVAKRVAHEIKNPLTPIRMSAERIRKKLAGVEAETAKVATKCCDTIVQEVDGLKTLVNAFARFAQMPPVVPVSTRLDTVIENVLSAYDGVHGGIELDVKVSSNIPVMPLDPEQFKRVLTNLIDNAVECMEGVGKIELKALHDERGRAVIVEVADEGPGIDAKDRAKLFIPHFSTKARGRGLGLALVHRIVSDHNGTIRVEDNLPQGTRFVIDLPA